MVGEVMGEGESARLWKYQAVDQGFGGYGGGGGLGGSALKDLQRHDPGYVLER